MITLSVNCRLKEENTHAHRHTQITHNSERKAWSEGARMGHELSIPSNIQCLSGQVLPTRVFNHFLGVTTVNKT